MTSIDLASLSKHVIALLNWLNTCVTRPDRGGVFINRANFSCVKFPVLSCVCLCVCNCCCLLDWLTSLIVYLIINRLADLVNKHYV